MKDRDLPLGKHLEELRKRLAISVIVLVATTVVSFVFYKQIIRLLLRPADDFGPAIGGSRGWCSSR